VITVLFAVSAALNVLLLGLVHDLVQQRDAECKRAQEEAAWAEQREHELSELRQHYAVLEWVYEGTNMLELGAAWRHGVRAAKGVPPTK
jgi:hypothetical protein